MKSMCSPGGKATLYSLMKLDTFFVGDNSAFPLLYAHNGLRNFQCHVTFHLTLAAESPVILYLFTTEVWSFGIENLTSSFNNLHLTLSTACLTTTCRRQEDTVFVQRCHDGTTLVNGHLLIAINRYRHLSTRTKVLFSHKQEDYQHQMVIRNTTILVVMNCPI